MRIKWALQCAWSSILTAALFSLPSYAATPDAVSAAELKKALAFYQKISQLEVDFKQTKLLKDIQLKLESEGELKVNPPNRVLWSVIKPKPLNVTLDEQKITIQSTTDTQTFSQADNPSAKDRQSFNAMLSWLKLDADALMSQYNVVRLEKNRYRFTSKSKDESPIKSLEMEMNNSGHVANLKLEEASGDEIQIRFGKPKVQLRESK